jgi:GNAT superfamily N-acetyltransferase
MAEIMLTSWSDVPDRARLTAALDEIFFEASNTTSFKDEAQRNAFRERWLGRYLSGEPDLAFMAFADGALAGYVCGSLDDPARSARFADLGYFADFAKLTARYPAQLHVNVARAWRNRGIGARLIDVFCNAANDAGVPGVHVVTEEGARNVGFYQRNGFQRAGAAVWNGRPLVFLARDHGGSRNSFPAA